MSIIRARNLVLNGPWFGHPRFPATMNITRSSYVPNLSSIASIGMPLVSRQINTNTAALYSMYTRLPAGKAGGGQKMVDASHMLVRSVHSIKIIPFKAPLCS